MVNGIDVGDYIRYNGNYGVIDNIFQDSNNEMTIQISWFVIDKNKGKISGVRTTYHTRELLFEGEKVDKTAVLVEVL